MKFFKITMISLVFLTSTLAVRAQDLTITDKLKNTAFNLTNVQLSEVNSEFYPDQLLKSFVEIGYINKEQLENISALEQKIKVIFHSKKDSSASFI